MSQTCPECKRRHTWQSRPLVACIGEAHATAIFMGIVFAGREGDMTVEQATSYMLAKRRRERMDAYVRSLGRPHADPNLVDSPELSPDVVKEMVTPKAGARMAKTTPRRRDEALIVQCSRCGHNNRLEGLLAWAAIIMGHFTCAMCGQVQHYSREG